MFLQLSIPCGFHTSLDICGPVFKNRPFIMVYKPGSHSKCSWSNYPLIYRCLVRNKLRQKSVKYNTYLEALNSESIFIQIERSQRSYP